jgi:hypothetical protein
MTTTSAYERMIEARRPPDLRSGVLGWLHKNLFNGPINSAVTVIAAALLAWALWPMLQWSVFQADWIGQTRADCAGEGACWVFISARFETIVYGFYPPAARWRVDIVFAMLAILAAWLMIPRLPYKRQNEAGQALGLGYWQRMGLIILPQALKLVIPGIVNTFIALFKDTSLVLIIGLFDLLAIIRAGLTDPSWLGFATEGYVFAALMFWIFCFSMSRYSQYIERKLHTGHKR